MLFFQSKPKCPNCFMKLQEKPTRKQECPNCEKLILVRDGELVTEEQAAIMDSLNHLEVFKITKADFDRHREQLSKKFGFQAGVNDVIWRILNLLLVDYATNNGALEQAYREMARLAASEGKDPTQYLVEAENVRRRYHPNSAPQEKQVFLGQSELEYVRKLRKDGKLDQASELLLKAEPSPAVLGELRKIASTKAKAAKKENNWEAVVQYLDGYTEYANQWREHCIKRVNQEPPAHTETDIKLLLEAKKRIAI